MSIDKRYMTLVLATNDTGWLGSELEVGGTAVVRALHICYEPAPVFKVRLSFGIKNGILTDIW